MRNHLISLGLKIRELRKKQNMTLQDFAGKTGLSAGLLSKIENFRAIPSLPVLVRIASALETDMGILFEGISFERRKKWILIRSNEHRKVEREESVGMHYEALLEMPLNADGLQAMMVSVQPGAHREDVYSDGDELLYLLSGRLVYFLDGEPISLAPGDLLYFDGNLRHHPRNDGPEEAVLLAFYFLRGGSGRD